MYRTVLSILSIVFLLLSLPAASWGGNSHNKGSEARERQAWWADSYRGWVASGCAPAVPGSSLTMAAFACKAYAVDTGEMYYIDQAAATVTLSGVSATDTLWLGVHRDRTSTVSGWTREALTHYIWINQDAEPAEPAGVTLIAQIGIASSVIGTIEPMRYTNPLARAMGVISITDPAFGAVGDDSTDNTTAIQAAIDASERHGADRICVRIPGGIFRHTGLTFTKGLCMEGAGWGSILKNTSATNHSISRVATGTGDTETQAIAIRNLALQHSGGGSAVDGIHIEETSKFVEIHRVYVKDAPRDGISLTGVDGVADGNTTYAHISHNWVQSAGRDALTITGPANAGVIIGGRYNNTARYGISIADSDASYPNTWAVIGTDIPGDCDAVTYTTCAPLYDNGHTNRYFGIRFEGTDAGRPDILIGAQATHPQFFGTEHSTTATAKYDDSAQSTRNSTHWGRDHSNIDPVNAQGFFGFYAEDESQRWDMPKRGRYTQHVPSQAAGSGTTTYAGMRCEDNIIIKGAWIIPGEDVTGHDTNYPRLQFLVGAAGSGPPVTVRSIKYEDFLAGVDLTQNEPYDLLTNGTGAGSTNCEEGDSIVIQTVENGTVAIPEFTLQLEFEGGEFTTSP